MTLKTLFVRLRASLRFRGFQVGGVHKTEAQETLDDLRRLRSTIPPKHLRDALDKAK